MMRQDFLPKEIKHAIQTAVIWIFLLFLVLNPFNSSFVMSLNSQEFISYHIKDALENLPSKRDFDVKNYYLATGVYEKQKHGDLFGIAKGKNLIVIQMEAMQNMLIGKIYNGQEITPNLNRLIREQGTIYFDNFYQQIGSGNTSDAEFAINNSIMGSIESFTYQLHQGNYLKGLPWILKEQGYQTAVFHGYDKTFWNRENMYPVEGFDTFISSDQLVNDHIEGIGGGNIVGISDYAFFQQSLEYLKEMEEKPDPFYSFLITLSSHNPFHLPDSLRGLELLPKDQDNIVGNYLNAEHYADQCIGEFLDALKEEGLYENSVIALYGDHFGLTKSDPQIAEKVTEFLGFEYDYDIMLNIPLILHIPGYEGNQTVSISGGQLDFMPTICYLLGVEQLDTIYLGQNLLTADSGFVAGQTHLLKGSFIKDDLVFEISRDGVFENSRAYNRLTRREVAIDGLKDDYLRAKEIVELSDFYLRNDILRQAILEGKTMEQIIAGLNTEQKMPSDLTLLSKSNTAAAFRQEESSINKTGGAAKPEHGYLSALVRWMNENGGEPAAVLMDNTLDGLKELEERFNGSAKRPGLVRLVDPEMSAALQDIKSRTIPVIRTMEDYTKIEYMGYDRILFMPDLAQYTRKQLVDFIQMNRPCAVAIPADQAPSQFHTLLSGDIFVYAYDVSGPAQKAALSAIGVDGFIETVELDSNETATFPLRLSRPAY